MDLALRGRTRSNRSRLPAPATTPTTAAIRSPISTALQAHNPRATQSTIASTICTSGYASSIRPPESVTETEKQASASAYGYTGALSTAEYDHLVPLQLGGDPNDPANLWVEPNDNPNATSTTNSKDLLEDRLNNLVCSGQLGLATAQEAIASNWVMRTRSTRNSAFVNPDDVLATTANRAYFLDRYTVRNSVNDGVIL